jgi:signal transduction histidine kinase
VVPAIGGVAVVLSVPCLVASGVHRPEDFADPLVLTPAFWAAGAIAYTYRPGLRCARLLCAAGTLIAISHLLASAPPAVHALAVWPVNLASQLLFLVGFAAWGALLAVFPDGQVETRKERWWLRLIPSAAAVVGTLGFFSAPTQPQLGVLTEPATPVPLWSSQLVWVHNASALIFAAPVVGLVLLALRCRRAEGTRRAQMRLPLLASGLAVLALLSSSLLASTIGSAAQTYVFVAAVGTLPAALVIGMVRDGLFDLDRFALRSLVFGILWLLIAGVCVTVAAAPGVAVGPRLPVGFTVAIAVVAAMAFQPVRTRLERLADRWVYGERLSAEDAVRRLGSALAETGDSGHLADVVAGTVRRGLRCAWVRVRVDGQEAGWSGNNPLALPADVVVPLRHAGAVIGAIECGNPATSDTTLLENLALQVAAALHSADLGRRLAAQVGELRASRERLVRAEETERRRIERDLHDGVQAQLVALAAKVDLARLQQRRQPEALSATLDELSAAVRAAHVDLRELVRGIHPAVLEDHGLVQAIEARTAALPLQVRVEADRDSREARLPLHLEGAAYFFAVEGITNVVRHARADRAVIQVSRRGQELWIEVIDSGRGFAPTGVNGSSGLRGLSDRLQALGGRVHVTSSPGSGTRLLGVLPVGTHG